MSYCPKCKKTGGCTHTDRQFPYSLPAEMARLERALNAEREAHARTLAALERFAEEVQCFDMDFGDDDSELEAQGALNRAFAAVAAAKVTP